MIRKQMMVFIVLSCMAGVIVADGKVGEITRIISDRVAPLMSGKQPDSVKKSPVSGLYEIIYGSEVFYASEDGQFLLDGDIIDLQHRTNLTEERRSQGRMRMIQSLDQQSMIIFSSPKPQYTVTVFTDIDCPYCRKMHQEMSDYLANGISVRYLAFPRAGVNSGSYKKAVAVWCAKDRNMAMTRAKAGETIVSEDCDHPINEHLQLVQSLGITGTPTIILTDGSMLPGYVPASRLRQIIEQQ